jgi:hypothetical protein
MATVTAPTATTATTPRKLPGRRYDHYFFSATVFLMLVTVFFGFAPTYYLAGVFHAPLPSLLVHFHGAAFTLWMLLLITQTSLVAAHRTDIHKRLGMAGFALGCLMLVLGLLAATQQLVRQSVPGFPLPPGRDPLAFYIVPCTGILLFATFLAFGFRSRFDSTAHKRYLFLATTSLLDAAVARIGFLHHNHNLAVVGVITSGFLILLAAYDYWSTRKIHRVTLWAGALLILVQQLRLPFSTTALWHSFANWILTLAR